MGFFFRKQKQLGRGTTLNITKSGASVSKRVGPVRLSTRGRGSIRLGKGFSFRFKL